MTLKKIILTITAGSICAMLFNACGDKTQPGWEFAPQMYRSVPYNPDQPNANFKDGKTALTPPVGTIKQGFESFGYQNTLEDYERAGLELKNPIATTPESLEEGKQLFLNMCSHCHGKEGRADGAIVVAGKYPVPQYQSENIKNLPEGKIFFSITYGKNLMGPHASQLSKEERWKIVQFVQTLQKL